MTQTDADGVRKFRPLEPLPPGRHYFHERLGEWRLKAVGPVVLELPSAGPPPRKYTFNDPADYASALAEMGGRLPVGVTSRLARKWKVDPTTLARKFREAGGKIDRRLSKDGWVPVGKGDPQMTQRNADGVAG